MFKFKVRDDVSSIGIYEFIFYLLLLITPPVLAGYCVGAYFGVTVVSMTLLGIPAFVYGLVFSRLYAFARGKVIRGDK